MSPQNGDFDLTNLTQVDALCDELESQLKATGELRLSRYLDRVSPTSRGLLLKELVKLAAEFLETSGAANPLAELERWNPELESEIVAILNQPSDVCLTVDHIQPAENKSNELPTARQRSGLHCRCPHCYNAIELVLDAELESIRCESCGSQFSLTTDDEETTRDSRGLTQVGHFRLVERVGMGAFGTVWKAQDTELDRTVAVKIPRAGQLDKARQDMFLREARSAAQLRHPNIVPVYEVGREGETLYIVSEFVRGVTLADRLTAGPYSSREATELTAKIADALHHAHEQGVIHRDLKPGNIMIDGAGEPHLMDFGLARREAGEITMTLDGQILGTPAYMSPEQAQGESHVADRRSDVYSLGVILFELLTGELPFRGNSRMLIHQVINDEPPSPRKLNSGVPKDLETITLKCLQKDAKRRFETAAELGEELRRYLAGRPILSRPIGRIQRSVRLVARNKLVSGLGAFAAMAFLSGTIVSLLFAFHAKQQAELALAREWETGAAKLEAAAAKAKGDILDEIVVTAERGFQRLKAQSPSNDPYVTRQMSSLVETYRAAHRLKDALETMDNILSRTLTQKDLSTDASDQLVQLVDDCLQAGLETEANELVDKYAAATLRLETANEELGMMYREGRSVVEDVAEAYVKLHCEDQALKFSRELYNVLREKYGPQDTRLQNARRAVTFSELKAGIAIPRAEEKLVALSKAGARSPEALLAASDLEQAYRDAGRDADAFKLTEQYGLFAPYLGVTVRGAHNSLDELMQLALNWPNSKQLRPRDAIVLGELLLVAGEPRSAEVAIRQAIETGPTEPYFYKSLVWCLVTQGKMDEARNTLREITKGIESASVPKEYVMPDAYTATFLVGDLSESEYVEKCGTYSNGIRLPTADSFPWFYVAQRRELEDRSEEAVSAYRKCVARSVDNNPQKSFSLWRLARLVPERTAAEE